MTGDEVRQVFEAMRPPPELDRLCKPCGVIERERKLHRGMFVRAMVIAAGPPGGAYQAEVWRSSLEFEVPHVARSAVSRGFDVPLEQCMAALAQRALAYARAQPVDRSGPRGRVQDGSIVDSTTVTVRDARRQACPGAGDDAAIKVHTGLSVGCGAPVHDPCSPAREHDRRPLQIDASWPGCGLLADLAYASLARLRACDTQHVCFVMRLQENGKPKVDSMARGQVTQACFPGTDGDPLLEDDTRVLDGRAIDAAGHVGGDTHPWHRRLVGVQTPKGDGCFLTNLPARIGPRQVADLDRVGWEVELRSRLDTSVHRLDAIDAARPCALKALLHASRIASTSAARLAPTPQVHTRPQQAGTPRTAAPLHPRRLAWPRAVSCQSIAQAFELEGAEAQQRWNTLAELLTHAGRDPNWRRRPSMLAQLRGWQRQPSGRKEANSGNGRHGNFKTAA
jgi:Transposase DDE domain